jgi:transposase
MCGVGSVLCADKGSKVAPIHSITPVIPPKANRKVPRACDFALYCERNLIERFFNKLKHFRAIATRYDKLAKIFLAGVQLASAMIILN